MIGQEYKIRLTRAEEAALVAQMRAGDLEARRKLIESQIPWMRKLAGKACRKPEHLDDLTQVAMLALIESLDDFDPARSRLTTYVVRPAFWRMRRARQQLDTIVHRPCNRQPKYAELWDRALHVGELVDELPAGDEPSEIAIGREQITQLRNALAHLSPRDREILDRRMRGETLVAIGKQIRVSKERVRQIETRAIAQLRKLLDVSPA
jgi:RNA polymerase sigma factor (sigma-70 family)